MSGTADLLDLLEVLLTAEIFNQRQNLDVNDLTPVCRDVLAINGAVDVKRPVIVSESAIQRVLGISDPRALTDRNPVVLFEEFGKRYRVTGLDPAARYFLTAGGSPRISRNPTLASYFEGTEGIDATYQDARASNPPVDDTRAFLDARIARISADDQRIRDALDLIIMSAPDEVIEDIHDLVLTPEQHRIIQKIRTALRHRDHLKRHRIHEIGKLLFVGPPGTGKTSLAFAMSRQMHMPILEVRLSMITSQYLGETSKNIDKIFDLAKMIAPCILFIDEFDYVAKSRTTDDHGAMKRAVNSLLKNIDRINLVRNNVLLIGATNHPQLLDEAAWRRFDEIVEFGLPDTAMREAIIRSITGSLACHCNYERLAGLTGGFSGADLRMMVKEAVVTALIAGRHDLSETDIEEGIAIVKNREAIRQYSCT